MATLDQDSAPCDVFILYWDTVGEVGTLMHGLSLLLRLLPAGRVQLTGTIASESEAGEYERLQISSLDLYTAVTVTYTFAQAQPTI